MTKEEIAATLREDIGALEATIKKLQARCDRMKNIVYALEEEIEAKKPRTKQAFLENPKFRKVIDSVFGEKPQAPKKR